MLREGFLGSAEVAAGLSNPPTPGSGVWEGLGSVQDGNWSKGSFETSSGGLGDGVPMGPNEPAGSCILLLFNYVSSTAAVQDFPEVGMRHLSRFRVAVLAPNALLRAPRVPKPLATVPSRPSSAFLLMRFSNRTCALSATRWGDVTHVTRKTLHPKS